MLSDAMPQQRVLNTVPPSSVRKAILPLSASRMRVWSSTSFTEALECRSRILFVKKSTRGKMTRAGFVASPFIGIHFGSNHIGSNVLCGS